MSIYYKIMHLIVIHHHFYLFFEAPLKLRLMLLFGLLSSYLYLLRLSPPDFCEVSDTDKEISSSDSLLSSSESSLILSFLLLFPFLWLRVGMALCFKGDFFFNFFFFELEFAASSRIL